jgi:hypothetical protein
LFAAAGQNVAVAREQQACGDEVLGVPVAVEQACGHGMIIAGLL